MQDYSSLSDSIALVRGSSLEELLDASFLENRMLPDLGGALGSLEVQGEELAAPSGARDSCWACPGELARFLVYLSRQGIRSYMEIGCRSGATAILITEYLSRFTTLERVALIEDDEISPQLLEYRKHREFDYLQGVSSVALLAPEAEGVWDLVLIDGSRGLDRVRSDFIDVADEAKIVAVQDIVTEASADFSPFWTEVEALADPADIHEFMADSPEAAGSRCRIGVVTSPGSVRLPFWSASSPSLSSWSPGPVVLPPQVPSDECKSSGPQFVETPVPAFPEPRESEELDEVKSRNYARYVVTMREGRTEAWNTPLTVFLETSNRCNFRCVFCAKAIEGVAPTTDIMPVELMAGIAAFLPGLGTLELHGHGEPLLNPHFVETALAGLGHKSNVAFFTNGSLLNSERAARLVGAGLSRITVSISSADPDTYARLYKGGRLSKLEANLMNLKEEKRRQNRILPALLFNAIAMRSSFPDLPGLVRFAAKVGAQEITLTPLVAYPGLESEHISYCPERDDAIIDEARRIAKEAGVILFVEPYLGTKGAPEGLSPVVATPTPAESTRTPDEPVEDGIRLSQPCNQVFSTMLVHANGEVKPCCRAMGDVGSLGDATKQSLEEIWNGPLYQRLRAQHLALEVPPMCAPCILSGTVPREDEAVAWLVEGGMRIVDYETFSAALDTMRVAFADLNALTARHGGGETDADDLALPALLVELTTIVDRVTASTIQAMHIGRHWPPLGVTLSSAGDLTEEFARVLERVSVLGDAKQDRVARDYVLSVVGDFAVRGQHAIDVTARAFDSLIDQLSIRE